MSWVEMAPETFTLLCDMERACLQAPAMIDTAGFIYCADHGFQRRQSEPCRKMRPWEIRRLQKGMPIAHY